MLVAHSFDLWQKDAFFSAAEEVQDSADILESTYRRWLRERSEGLITHDQDGLTGELRMALGTAKWQLEEFEKAVRFSYGQHGDGTKLARHRQFIDAIENQIFLVEASLHEYFIESGKQPLQWINLNEEECDDLAAFLSGTTHISQVPKSESLESELSSKTSLGEDYSKSRETSHNLTACCSLDTSEKVEEIQNGQYIVDLNFSEISLLRDDVVCHADRKTNARRTCGSPKFDELRINIPDEDEQRNPMVTFEATPKEKGSRTIFCKLRSWEFFTAKAAVLACNQLFARVLARRQLHSSSPSYPQRGCSIQLTLALMLTIFLLVPFLLYST